MQTVDDERARLLVRKVRHKVLKRSLCNQSKHNINIHIHITQRNNEMCSAKRTLTQRNTICELATTECCTDCANDDVGVVSATRNRSSCCTNTATGASTADCCSCSLFSFLSRSFGSSAHQRNRISSFVVVVGTRCFFLKRQKRDFFLHLPNKSTARCASSSTTLVCTIVACEGSIFLFFSARFFLKKRTN